MGDTDAELKPPLMHLVNLIQGQQVRLDRIEAKVDQVEAKVDRLEAKVDQVEAKVDRLEAKVDQVEAKVDCLEAKVDAGFQRTADLFQVDRGRIDEVRGGLDVLGKRFDALVVPKSAAE